MGNEQESRERLRPAWDTAVEDDVEIDLVRDGSRPWICNISVYFLINWQLLVPSGPANLWVDSVL